VPIQWIDAELTEDDQVVSALVGNAAAFAAIGGVALMLTEAVENGSDAILEARETYGMEEQGTIVVEIDPVKEVVYVVDNGTGILQPVHILRKPFKSLRRNADYAVGQFGRGLQGFRKFCEELLYVSRRPAASPEEATLDRSGFSGRTIRLQLIHNKRQGGIEVVDDDEFEDYGESQTGTVAIYRNWFPGEFKLLDLPSFQARLQHHFGELIRKGLITIFIRMGEEELELEPREFDPTHLIPLEDIEVPAPDGTLLGKIEFDLYYTSKSDRHEFKRPFLMVGDRPLGDSFVGDFPEFRDQAVWSSHYLTGFIRCNFVEPNDLRLALQPGMAKDFFVRAVREIAPRLERQVKEFQRQLFDHELQAEMNELAVQVQRFLRAEGIFDFRSLLSPGQLAEAETHSAVDLVAAPPGEGDPDLPSVTSQGGDAAVIEEGGRGGPLPGPGPAGEGPGPGPGPLPDPSGPGGTGIGLSDVQVQVDPRLLGHVPRRRRQRRPTGFGLNFEPNELSTEMSWFEETTQTVIVNSAHERYTALSERAMEAGEDSTYAKKLRIFIIQRYLWEIVMFAGQRQGLGRVELEDRFWNLNYKFFETRGP